MILKNTFLTALIWCAFTLQAQTIQDSNYENQITKARMYVDSLKKAQKIPAISIAVGVSGKVIWSEAIGLADVKNEIPANVKTKFRVGSVGKTMTAIALGKLYDQGAFNWDDTLSNYISDFKLKKYPVTIRQVAGHTAGIRHYKGFEFLSNEQFESIEESMKVFIDDPLEFIPGTKYLYSTYGYVVLGRLIEVISNQSYLDYMTQEIFEPLGMDNTVAENSGANVTNKAVFYGKSGRREAKKVNMSNKWAAGGFLSTPIDLVNMTHNTRKIISAETLFELISSQKLNNGESTGYALGWKRARIQSNNRLLIHHGGRSVGSRSYLLLLPEDQVVVAICTNMESDFGLLEVYKISKFFL